MMGEFLTFLKMFTWVSGATFSFQVASDVYKSVKKKGGIIRMQKIKGFPLGNEHITVLGITQHGKTYATMETLKWEKGAVFFFNPQDERLPYNFTLASRENTFSEIYNALRNGKKINYIPSDNLEVASKELEYFINNLYEKGNLNFRLVVDEVHLLSYDKAKRGLKACQRLATTGLKRGYKGIWITQRGALIDNTLLNQSTKHILFALGNQDYAYLKSNGFPVEEIKSIVKGEKYKFCIYDLKEVKGAYMIG